MISNPLQDKVFGFHYVQLRKYQAMQSSNSGLHPAREFTNERVSPGLSPEAYRLALFSLLEEKPESWIRNQEFSKAWLHLIIHIAKGGNSVLPEQGDPKYIASLANVKLALLSFPILPTDEAYVVDRSPIERIDLTDQRIGVEAHRMYWESRIPVAKYKDQHDLPELVLFNPVEIERLELITVQTCGELFLEYIQES